MPLQHATRDFLALVERETGYPVRVFEKPELQALAIVRPARGNVPAHIVQYKPTRDETLDYLICYQCGFLLRQFELPPAQRFDLIGSLAGRAEILNELSGPHSPLTDYGLPPAQIEQLADLFCDGLLTHLRSIPIGLRVAEWLAANYPHLHAGQRATVLKETAAARSTLVGEARDIAPARIFTATQGISAAYGQYWADVYGLRELATPWQFAGFEKAGRQLLDLWRSTPADPGHDRELIEAWADALGIRAWLAWIPYDTP